MSFDAPEIRSQQVILMEPKDLRPHERVSYIRAAWLLIRVCATRKITTPVLVDAESKVILDGHHRWTVSRWIGLKSIPCHSVDYLHDPSIKVHPRRANIPVSKYDVVQRGQSGKRYPNKTTRHEYKRS